MHCYFFIEHVLNKEFGKVEGVVRAKRKPYVPVVLSRAEIETILQHLPDLRMIWWHTCILKPIPEGSRICPP